MSSSLNVFKKLNSTIAKNFSNSGFLCSKIFSRSLHDVTKVQQTSPKAYSKLMCWMHWLTAPALIGTVGAVLYSQQLKGKERGNVLFLHKSLGLLTAFIAIPRIIGSLTSQHPESFKKGILGTAGKLNHLFLYIFLVVMPSSGILMGYFGGKGLPFFFTTLKGSEKPNESISKKSFWLHKNFGSYAKYLIPLHVGAVGFHLARGEAIFARINPFRKL